MAIQASGEIVIDAPPEVIMEALADMGAVPSWSVVHKRVEVVDHYPDGRPHHVRVTIKVTGIADTELLEYHWGPDWMVWDAQRTVQQHGQHGEYNLRREADNKTRVRFSITVEPSAPLPEFWVNRARRKILHSALEGLRKRVMGTAD
ncbi:MULTISPECIES: SRPBCC family protein [Mycobacterium ulcerans group]|uniref:SRPBCC family protein n=1 Tax=Mycobacterium ulcerans group TaxID=2993898 RepID=UPI0005612ADB|nr:MULTISPECIES: SRPBCC family protein [Mycobacterium ulcerans group]MDC8973688.1 SRPBCC family protein [Mycobacterium marinum]MDC8983816.1 SRPBCC family protein [Mycobacterium marinum]MDC8994589.1 SRPBCC family protein [Mycobacterium marinum]MDC9000892.1 SRPBCC family protein [Mycobacterium marinum]MDC9005822.1 SRPBCC family protein [Mycobacterium marinum]